MPKIRVTAAAKAPASQGSSVAEASVPVKALADLEETMKPVSLTARVCFKSGTSQSYPHQQVVLQDKSGKTIMKVADPASMKDVKVDDVVVLDRVTVHKAVGHAARSFGHEIHFHPKPVGGSPLKRQKTGPFLCLG